MYLFFVFIVTNDIFTVYHAFLIDFVVLILY